MSIQTRLDINIASTEELEEVRGIEPDLAHNIVNHRTLHGPFNSIEDLREVEGITDEMISDMMRTGITLF